MDTTQPLPTPNNAAAFNDPQACTDFFQQRLRHLLTYWRDHEAVQELQIAVLDRERAVILKVINFGLDIEPLWCIARPLIIALTPYMERRGHWDEWQTVLERAITVAQQREEVETETTLTSLLARLSQRMSRPDDVIKYYRHVIRLAKRSKNRFEEARACSNLGYLYIDGGRWWRSEVLSKHALEIFEELDNDHGRAHTHNHLGVLYTRQSIPMLAEEHLLSACNLWLKSNDTHSLVFGYDNLGLLYIGSNKPLEALSYFEMALEIAAETGEEVENASILNNIGYAYRISGDFEKAETYSKRAEELFQLHSDFVGLATAWGHLGVINLKRQDWSNARFHLKCALREFRRHNNKHGEEYALTHLIECEIESNHRSAAIGYLNEFEMLLKQFRFGTRHPKLEEQLEGYRQRLVSDSKIQR